MLVYCFFILFLSCVGAAASRKWSDEELRASEKHLSQLRRQTEQASLKLHEKRIDASAKLAAAEGDDEKVAATLDVLNLNFAKVHMQVNHKDISDNQRVVCAKLGRYYDAKLGQCE